MAASLLLFLLLGSPMADEVPWYRHYEAGLQSIDDGRPEEARQSLEKALAARQEPGLRLPTEGIRYVDYLPDLYLAIACQMSGDQDAALRYLAASEDAGAARDSVAGSHLLEAYQILLKVPAPSLPTKIDTPPAAGGEGSARPAGPSYLDYERASEKLSEEDLEKLKAIVLSRCGLYKDSETVKAPWYFHYELAQELERQGDSQRALDAYIEATRRRPRPRRGARMYGMWFTDYLPYYRIARAHAALGNWDCVSDALRVAESLGEVRSGDREFDDYVTLRGKAEAHR